MCIFNTKLTVIHTLKNENKRKSIVTIQCKWNQLFETFPILGTIKSILEWFCIQLITNVKDNGGILCRFRPFLKE